MITTSTLKDPVNDDHTSDDSNSKDLASLNFLQDDDDHLVTYRSRKSYPQRNNRPKLNYRDLERGLYDTHELRQSTWALGGPTFLDRNERDVDISKSSQYSDDEEDDASMDANDDKGKMAFQKSDKAKNDDADQMHRRLWCICKKPWDHARHMLRCDSCANWYHGDCIGVTKEQARVLDMNGDQFVCPPCQGTMSNRETKSEKPLDPSIQIKRKRIDAVSPIDRKVEDKNGSITSSKSTVPFEPLKRPKTGIFFQRNSSTEPQIHCIVHGCSSWAKSGWVYCSPACIRRHINDTLQAIQRSKGENNDNPPAREDILLYESRMKKVLDRKLVPKIEDLCTWINQHPSYEIVKPALRQSILLTANELKPLNTGLVRPSSSSVTPIAPKTPPTPTSTKQKLSWAPVAPNPKTVPIKKAPVQLAKPTTTATTTTASTSSNVQNYADIRMKVPQALYDKLTMRLEKSGEKLVSNEEIRTLVEKIEEEMYRVFGKVDNSYKNKFRSLLSNISNMNNNYFYKYILSKELTPKQIVAMKSEDMLPPEEKEKRKDEFEKEVQMIIKAEEQTAEEMARRARTRVTRQGLVDNDAVLPVFKLKEKSPGDSKKDESKLQNISKADHEAKNVNTSNSSKPVTKIKKPVSSTSGQKPTITKPKPTVKKPVVKNDSTPSHVENIPDTNLSQHTSSSSLITLKPSSPKSSSPNQIEKDSQPIEPAPIRSLDESKPVLPSSPVREESAEISGAPSFPSMDLDNDYIEPESPTGIDALLYDDDDDLNSSNIHSRPSIIQQQQTISSPTDSNENIPQISQIVRDDYNPIAASKSKTEVPQIYQPTPISRPTPSVSQWSGVILAPDMKVPCQSLRVYGESDYLINEIPEQLGILGRLRLGDMWDYIRDSLAVRDVVILTLTSSNNNENNAFSRYVDAIRVSGRAAVINKRTDSLSIRDMYVLAADIKDSPSTVTSTLSLSTAIDPKHLFLIVVGTGKRTKSLPRPGQSQSLGNITYKPVSLQDSATMRDPRLVRNKDPRFGASTIPETASVNTASLSTSQPISSSNTKIIPTESSTDDLNKLVSESISNIRRFTTADAVQPIILSTIERLRSLGREDLCARFTNELKNILSTWKTSKEPNPSTSSTLTDDNLNEENMEVDDEQDEKHKKQSYVSEFNDIDYRFLDADMDHRVTIMPAIFENDRQHQRALELTKNPQHTSHVLSADRDADHRPSISNPTRDARTTMIGSDSDFRTDDLKKLLSK